MSREVRRVPLGWEHPVEANPYWEIQHASRKHRGEPESRLHRIEERFIGLSAGYADRYAEWVEELRVMREREGPGWNFEVCYHLTGFQGSDDEPTVHPFSTWSDDGETEVMVNVRDEDHLHELAVAQLEDERPKAASYMPEWDIPTEQLGWCLYETVTEGTPVTPVFATAEELVDHLATHGQDWDQQPMRRAAAESLVERGSSVGSMVAIGGQVFRSDVDADVIQGLMSGPQKGRS